jgi:hypothetical protein
MAARRARSSYPISINSKIPILRIVVGFCLIGDVTTANSERHRLAEEEDHIDQEERHGLANMMRGLVAARAVGARALLRRNAKTYTPLASFATAAETHVTG